MRQPYEDSVLDDCATIERQSSKKCEEHALQQFAGENSSEYCIAGTSQSWFWVSADL